MVDILTWILFALIVITTLTRIRIDMEPKTNKPATKGDITDLKESIDKLSGEIHNLGKKIDKLSKKLDKGGK